MHVICGRSNGEEGFGAGIWCSKCDLHRLQQESEVERIGIKRRQSKFHSRMLKSSASKMTSANVGDTVIIPIAKPDVMIPLGSKNLMGVIMDKNEDLYAIGTDQGRLESRYTRNQYDVCPTKLQKIDSVPDSVISQTTAMHNASMFVLQSCKCKNCSNLRCLCKRAKMRCNSRCHDGKACKTKHITPVV